MGAVSLAAEMSKRDYAVDFIMGGAAPIELIHLRNEGPLLNLHAVHDGKDFVSLMSWKSIASCTGRFAGSKVALMNEITKVTQDMSGPIKLWEAMVEILERQKPDLVVLDHSLMLAQKWAELHGFPTIILHTPYFLTGEPMGCARMNKEEQKAFDEVLRLDNPLGALRQVAGPAL